MADHNSDPLHHSEEEGIKKRKVIWRTFIILAVITLFEFIIAGIWDSSLVINMTFVLMTLVKAFFIVWEFMHLGHETKGLKYTIALPVLFLVWFVLAMLIEGDFYLTGWVSKFLIPGM